jgi:cobalt-zinc-cadmium efflux system outer membrane protein
LFSVRLLPTWNLLPPDLKSQKQELACGKQVCGLTPSLDMEQMMGGLTGSAGERETSIGVSLPLEVGGQRRRRIDVAQAQLEATEAEVAERERRLAAEVFVAYAEALSALRDLKITEGINEIDLQTARFVQARVNEGESAPIELSLLQVEVDRLKSRRVLVEGRLQASLLRLKNLAGIPFNEPLRLREDLSAAPVEWQPPLLLMRPLRSQCGRAPI